jgi:hypothetical protein
LALKREDRKGTLVHAAQRLASDEAFETFNPERELARSQRSLSADAAFP